MELGAASSIIAVVQITAQIATLCGGYIRDVHHARQDIQRMQSKVSALEKVLKRLQENPHLANDDAIAQCRGDLQSIEKNLKPSNTAKAMKRLGARALKWPFTSKDVDKKVKILEGYLHIFNTALQQNIDERVTSLQESHLLDKLAYVSDARFDSHENERHEYCLPNTRVGVLNDITQWATSASQRCIFWLRGMAGTGKSTVAKSVALKLRTMAKPLATYFFKRGLGDLAHARKLIPTIVCQLSHSSPAYGRHVLEALKVDPALGQSVNLRDQYEKLVLEPLRKLQLTASTERLFVVIDALDECDEERDLKLLLRLFATSDTPSLPLRIVVTSRPEWVIQQGFDDMPSIHYQDLSLHDVPRDEVDRDIEVFLKHELQRVQHDRTLSPGWPKDSCISTLVSKAAGLFIFAATACRYIGGSRLSSPQERLQQICSSDAQNQLMTKELDQMYTIILQGSVQGEYTTNELTRIAFLFHRIVGSIVILFSPLSVPELSRLLDDAQLLDQNQIDRTLKSLRAVIDVPEDLSESVQTLHLSFRDFLLDRNRCLDRQFHVDKRKTHENLAWDCVRLLSCSLQRDPCCLSPTTTLLSDIHESDINKALPLAVQYACRYWTAHIREGSVELQDYDPVHQFLQIHFLHWLEVMGLMGKVAEAIFALKDLVITVTSDRSPVLHDFIHDCRRFLLAFRRILDVAPGQIYESALLFSPQESIVRKTFIPSNPILTQLHPQIQARWSASLQTFEGHDGPVNSVAFSPDGLLLASGSYDCTVRLWDIQTGDIHTIFDGHSDRVNTVAFSPDGQLVVSGSNDHTFRLWDIRTGDIHTIFDGHSGWVNSVAFSLDGQLVVSGSEDRTVRLWDIQTGDIHTIFDGHSDRVNSVAFSLDGQLVVSGSNDHTVRLWDIRTGDIHTIFDGHSGWVNSVAFSPDGQLVVSGSDDCTVRLWDIQSGSTSTRAIFEGHSDGVNSIAFSPDGQLVASGSWDHTVRLWDIQSGSTSTRAIFEGHSNVVSSIAFSPDGQLVASGSSDITVRLWDIQSGSTSTRAIFDGHSGWVSSIAFSPDGQLVASGSYDCTVRLWDIQSGSTSTRAIFEGHSDGVNSIAFSPDGQLVASGSSDITVRLWDIQSGSTSTRAIFDGHSGWVSSIAFSPDGQLVASGSYDCTVRLWDIQSGSTSTRAIFEGHSDGVNSIAFSPDGQLVASGSYDCTVRLWDVRKAKHELTISLSSPPRKLEFRGDPNSLYIDSKAFNTHSGKPEPAATTQKHDAAVNDVVYTREEWVMKGLRRVLWLPPEHRPRIHASHGNILASGLSDGRVTLLFLEDGSGTETR